VVKETENNISFVPSSKVPFQSPLGEVVKETDLSTKKAARRIVSIPSRGSGKGDFFSDDAPAPAPTTFQSPLGEVVKETVQMRQRSSTATNSSFNPLSGKW
jgi:hypothetical protein